MFLRVLLLATILGLGAASAQAPKHEFRGVWIASVANLDWPSSPGLSTDTQKASLLSILDGLQSVGVNAVVFQVRAESDALYDSPFEPWSYWLTGEQGTPPSPYYDPLAFAVEAAHARGMELHVWINPYRADRGSNYPKAASHVTNTHPEWLLSFSQTGIKILDPGLPEVRDHVASVVADIVRRYDVDGVHYDDYFYPYPDGDRGFDGITNEDDATFATHARGFTDRGDWRRDNVNLLVGQIQDSIQAVRPEVVHGVSPFGLWKSGTPATTFGLDAYEVIYADAVAWLNAQDIDYLTPQLYWSSLRSFDSDGDGDLDFNNQRFTTLAAWWASVRNERHVYPGVAAYRSGQPGFEANEIPNQIRYVRRRGDLEGTVMFRAKSGVLFSAYGLADSLRTDLYRTPALPPVMPWKSMDAPGSPTALTAVQRDGSTMIDVSWTAPASGDADARFYAVYRIPEAEAGDLASAMGDSKNLAAVTGETSVTDVPMAGGAYTYVVTGVSANSIESVPSNAAVVQSSVATEVSPNAVLALDVPRPNPVHGQSTLRFALRQPARVTLRIVDVLGREVARLLDRTPLAADAHEVVWTPTGLVSGTYVVVLEAGGARVSHPVVVLR